MAVKKISELRDIPSLDGDAQIPIALNGTTYKIRLRSIKDLASAGSNAEISKQFIGLGNVDNTSDADKPVSVAQALALLTKADRVHSHTKSDITGLVTELTGIRTDIDNLVLGLSGKADKSHRHAIDDVSGLATELSARPTESDVATSIQIAIEEFSKNSVNLTKTEW